MLRLGSLVVRMPCPLSGNRIMSVSDWIGFGVIALLIVGVLFGLSQITKPYDVKTEEEFQTAPKERPGMMVAGLMGLQGILDPGRKESR